MSQTDDCEPIQIGEYVRDAIQAAGYRSPTAFARAADLDPSVVLRWIGGKAHPAAETLTRVAPLLKVKAADLIAVAYPDRAGLGQGLGRLIPDPPPRGMSPLEIARYLHPDVMPLVELITGSGLDEAELFEVVRCLRRLQQRQAGELLNAAKAMIRDAGGTPPNGEKPTS